MSRAQWIKSSYTGPNGNCVELTTTLDRIRDSKNPNGPTLKVNAAALVQAIKSGHFDH